MRDDESGRGGGPGEGVTGDDLDDELAATGATAGGVDRDMGGTATGGAEEIEGADLGVAAAGGALGSDLGGGTTGGRTSFDDVPVDTDDVDAGTAGGLAAGGGRVAGGPLGGAGASGARDVGGDAGGGATGGEPDRDPGGRGADS